MNTFNWIEICLASMGVGICIGMILIHKLSDKTEQAKEAMRHLINEAEGVEESVKNKLRLQIDTIADKIRKGLKSL